MDNWLTITMIIIAVVIIIGNLSTLQKNSKQPLRKKGLNDLKETLPRTHQSKHIMHSAAKKTHKKSVD